MIHLTIIASLITTLFFSGVALKIMGDAAKVLPNQPHASNQTCDVPSKRAASVQGLDSLNN